MPFKSLYRGIGSKGEGNGYHPLYTGKLCDYPVKKDVWRVLTGAEYRSDRAVTFNVVIRWKKGLPAKRDELWFLITDLEGNAVRLTELDARRMAVEELFRDGKDGRSGLGLTQTQVTTTARLDRLILILALALILLTGLGLLARGRFRPGPWRREQRPEGMQRRDHGPPHVGPDRRTARAPARRSRPRVVGFGWKLGITQGSTV